MNISPNAVQWLANGERGISSEAIFTHLTGIDALGDWHADHPHDPADLRRCRVLLDKCPELVPEFPRMASKSKVWKRLVENWDALCTVMDEECGDWRDPNNNWRAPKTYDLMQTLIR